MNQNISRQGTLFSIEYLTEAIRNQSEWEAFTDAEVQELGARLESILSKFPTDGEPNESRTEDDLIWPVLHALGWEHSLRNQNMNEHGWEVPDGLLFDDAEAKERANSCDDEWRRYKWGRVIVESKRWMRWLDRGSAVYHERTAPASQMVHYLQRVDERTEGRVRWGILTNGAVWRLYHASASSITEQFLEIDLAETLGLPGADGHEVDQSEDIQRHWLKVFGLLFRQQSFLPGKCEHDTFHQRALDESRLYEQRVSDNLSRKVFGYVFPELVRAIGRSAPGTELAEVRNAALVLLYRLLFILYAEDRDLLPIKERRYVAYSLRSLRIDISERVDRREVFSDRAIRYWSVLTDLFATIGEGDSSIGLPPYNGGLFDHNQHSVLTNIRIPDAVIAPVIDALSVQREDDVPSEHVNYRTVPVQFLGSVFRRLSGNGVTWEDGKIAINLETGDCGESGRCQALEDAVRSELRELVWPLTGGLRQRFNCKVTEMQSADAEPDTQMDELFLVDPAEAIVGLKICDSAMGPGERLVGLVNHLVDQVLAAIAQAELAVPEDWGDYISPMIHRIDTVRRQVVGTKANEGGTMAQAPVGDRHVVRRMVLKRCLYGADKDLMAVELAKMSLWLDSYTLGVPLPFLDHHLQHGDAVAGCSVRRGIEIAGKYGSPTFLDEATEDAYTSAATVLIVECLTDINLLEASHSYEFCANIRQKSRPLDALLSLLQAFELLNLEDQESISAVTRYLDGCFGDPAGIAMNQVVPTSDGPSLDGGLDVGSRKSSTESFASVFGRAHRLVQERRGLNWQVAFPGVWEDWKSDVGDGGFDLVIGNPQWSTPSSE